MKGKFFLQSILQRLEIYGARCDHFGSIYRRCFYLPILKKEFALADLKEGVKILHIGCGPLPITAIFLGKMGYSVLAVDNNGEAVAAAEQIVRRQSLEKKVHIKKLDGTEMDYSYYDVIWISLHANPLDKIIKRAAETMKEGAKILCRTSRSYLKPFYSSVDPREFPSLNLLAGEKQILGKKTLLFQKKRKGIMDLKKMETGTCGYITYVPEVPLLSPLGLRLGKMVRIEGKEPFLGPVIAEVMGRRVAIGQDLAEQILVESR